jgi:hypothetical protein
MLAAVLLLAAVVAVAAGSPRCELGGSWTTADPLPAQCEAKAWGCDKTGAQFWLTDTDDGFRGVAHGPADFVHAGNGPFQVSCPKHCWLSLLALNQCAATLGSLD